MFELSNEDSNPFKECKTKQDVIRVYKSQLHELEKFAKDKYGIDCEEFCNILLSCGANDEYQHQNEHDTSTPPISESSIKKQLHKKTANRTQNHDKISCVYSYNVYIQLKQYFVWIALLTIIIILVTFRAELSIWFMRNIQSFIYPGMRLWRKLTLPIIRAFPQLTELYDETCLVPNPFFQVKDLDCSPCANVINVVDLTNSPHSSSYFDKTIPHILLHEIGDKKQPNVTIAQIYQLYQKNRKMFRTDAYKVRSTDSRITNLDQLFDVLLNKSGKIEPKNSHNLWRINRMTPARILRSIIPQPKSLPLHAGIGIERFIAFDIGSGDTYQLPSTDCSNMYVYQAIGSRMIHLQPTNECKNQCRRISVKLKKGQILYYDWWYYKPISTNHFTKMTSVSYIGSYCY